MTSTRDHSFTPYHSLPSDDEDDSLLEVLPIFGGKKAEPLMTNFKKKKTIAEHSVEIIVLDDDEEVDQQPGTSDTSTGLSQTLGEIKIHSPTKETTPNKKIKLTPPKESEFTVLRDRPVDAPTTVGEWLEVISSDDDDELPPLPKGLIKTKITTTSTLLKNALIRSKKKTLSGKKLTKLKGKAPTRPRNARQNLFYDSDPEPEGQRQPLGRAPIHHQADAIEHITARISTSFYSLVHEELPKLVQVVHQEDGEDSEKRSHKQLAVKAVEDDPDILPNTTWSVSASLAEMLRNSRKEMNNSRGAICVRPNGILDHVIILVQAELLHHCVAHFVTQESQEVVEPRAEATDEELDLFKLLTKSTRKLATPNISLIIFGLEAYIKTQRTRAQRAFRRQIMDDERDGSGSSQPIRRKKTQAEADTETRPSLEHLTPEHIELCLVDTRMRLYYGEEERSTFTVHYIESGEELAGLLWKYSRSLAEQVWRLVKTRNGCVDFYAHTNLMSSIDPAESDESRFDLWRRQLQMFPNISAEIADTIAFTYPTPKLLYTALRQSTNPIALLARLGTTTSRKTVGDELAAKIVRFMVTSNPDEVLKSANAK